jgi:hypothetical protein
MIYLLTAIGLSPGGSSTVHINTKHYTESGKATGITYSECVSVALGNQHAQCMHRILLSLLGPVCSIIFFHIIT